VHDGGPSFNNINEIATAPAGYVSQRCWMKVEQQRSPRLAVLIDAENVSPKFADGIFKTIAQLGDAPVRLIYGNLRVRT